MKRKRGKQQGEGTWGDWLKENKVLSTIAGTAGTIASFIPGVNMLVAPALAGVSGGLALGGYGRKRGGKIKKALFPVEDVMSTFKYLAGKGKSKGVLHGGAVFTGGQVPIHRMTGAGVRGMVGGNSVYNNVGSSYGAIRV
jgi:hypothetical protein